MKDERLYLIHIWECIKRIESYAEEGKAAFLASRRYAQDSSRRRTHYEIDAQEYHQSQHIEIYFIFK